MSLMTGHHVPTSVGGLVHPAPVWVGNPVTRDNCGSAPMASVKQLPWNGKVDREGLGPIITVVGLHLHWTMAAKVSILCLAQEN